LQIRGRGWEFGVHYPLVQQALWNWALFSSEWLEKRVIGRVGLESDLEAEQVESLEG
jgi:hypothetical protein